MKKLTMEVWGGWGGHHVGTVPYKWPYFVGIFPDFFAWDMLGTSNQSVPEMAIFVFLPCFQQEYMNDNVYHVRSILCYVMFLQSCWYLERTATIDKWTNGQYIYIYLCIYIWIWLRMSLGWFFRYFPVPRFEMDIVVSRRRQLMCVRMKHTPSLQRKIQELDLIWWFDSRWFLCLYKSLKWTMSKPRVDLDYLVHWFLSIWTLLHFHSWETHVRNMDILSGRKVHQHLSWLHLQDSCWETQHLFLGFVGKDACFGQLWTPGLFLGSTIYVWLYIYTPVYIQYIFLYLYTYNIYIYIFTYAHIYIYVYSRIYNIYIYSIYIYAWIHTIYIYIYSRTHTIYIYISVYIYILYVYVNMCIYIHIYIYTYVYIYIYVYKPPSSLLIFFTPFRHVLWHSRSPWRWPFFPRGCQVWCWHKKWFHLYTYLYLIDCIYLLQYLYHY